MTNINDDRIYSSLVKICIILTTLFTFWLAWDHFSNRPLGYNEYSAANKAFKDKNYENAYKYYLKAYKLNDDVNSVEGLARSLMELKRYHESEKYFSIAINKDSDFAPAYANLGVLYDRLGEHERRQYKLDENQRILSVPHIDSKQPNYER